MSTDPTILPIETQIPHHYVTGGLVLAQHTGARYLVHGEDDASLDRTPPADGHVVEVGGRMRREALAAPSHTSTHLYYALMEEGARVAVFSAGLPAYGATFCSATQPDATSTTGQQKGSSP